MFICIQEGCGQNEKEQFQTSFPAVLKVIEDFKKGGKWNGGGSCDIASVWGVESRISVSMQARKVGESPEGSQAGKEDTPSI